MAVPKNVLTQKVFTVSELLRKKQLPLIVKDWAICDEKIERALEGINFPDDEFVIDKLANVDVAVVKVCPFVNEERRNSWRGDQYYLPAQYPGKFKRVLKPGSINQFSYVIQIINNLPSFVRADENCISDSFLKSEPRTIKQNTVLKVEGVMVSIDGKDKYVKLSGRTGEFYLKESRAVKMTAIPDMTTYTLQQLKASVFCPTWVQIENLPIKDVLFTDTYHRDKVIQILTKPIQVVKFRPVELVIVWTVENDKVVQCSVLPPKVFSVQRLEIQTCPVERHNRLISIRDETIIRRGLYMTSFKECMWLQKKQKAGIPTENTKKQLKEQKSEPWTSPTDVSFMKRAVSLQALNTTFTTLPEPRNYGTSRDVASRSRSFPSFREIKTYFTSKFRKSASFNGTATADIEYLSPTRDEANVKYLFKTGERIDAEDLSMTQNKTKAQCLPTSFPLSQSLIHDKTEQAYNCSQYDIVEKTKEEHVYEEILQKENADETLGSEFFNFTVKQVAECFKQCAVPRLANICQRQMLDGNFFKDFDFDQFTQEPFKLDTFTIKKVKKIVIDGWRPSI